MSEFRHFQQLIYNFNSFEQDKEEEKSGSDDDEDETSEEETTDSEDEEGARLKPVFVRKQVNVVEYYFQVSN